jgi:hypothetical protein
MRDRRRAEMARQMSHSDSGVGASVADSESEDKGEESSDDNDDEEEAEDNFMQERQTSEDYSAYRERIFDFDPRVARERKLLVEEIKEDEECGGGSEEKVDNRVKKTDHNLDATKLQELLQEVEKKGDDEDLTECFKNMMAIEYLEENEGKREENLINSDVEQEETEKITEEVGKEDICKEENEDVIGGNEQSRMATEDKKNVGADGLQKEKEKNMSGMEDDIERSTTENKSLMTDNDVIISNEMEERTEENDGLPEGEVSKKISDEDKIEDTEENLNDALKIRRSEDDVGVESEENKNLGETFGSGEEKRNTSEDIESLGRKLVAAVDKIAKEINSNIPKNEDDVSEVNREDKEVDEACEEGSTEKVEEDFDNLGRRLVEAVDKMPNELNCKNEEKDVCSVDVSEDKIEHSEGEVVTLIEERYELRKEAKQQIKKIHEENIKNYNRKRKMAREYKPGDQVAIKRKRTQFKTNAKILPKYLGRYEVIKKIGNDRYDVKKIGTHDGPRTTKSCAEMMKPWCQEDLDSFEANEFQDGRVVGNG